MEDTMRQTKQLLDYIATQEESIITYNASDMKLVAHSDATKILKQWMETIAITME